jgi:hypothetical protein
MHGFFIILLTAAKVAKLFGAKKSILGLCGFSDKRTLVGVLGWARAVKRFNSASTFRHFLSKARVT